YRQILGAAVNLSSAGKNNFHIRVVQPTCLQDMQLRNGIDIQVGQRIAHRIQVACLTGKIKKKVALFDQRGHGLCIADVSKLNAHLVAEIMDVEAVATVFRNQTINQRYVCPEGDKLPGQRRANESETACY